MRIGWLRGAPALLGLLALFGLLALPASTALRRAVAAEPARGLQPPLPLPLRVLRAFDPPAQPWLSGDRGVDLAAYPGEPVRAAANGVVLYAGELAGRGVVSIALDSAPAATPGTASGTASERATYEPVEAAVRVGARVVAGEIIGTVDSQADHCGAPGSCLHWGLIVDGSYVDPLTRLGQQTVRLLPIWADIGPDAENSAPTATTSIAQAGNSLLPAAAGGDGTDERHKAASTGPLAAAAGAGGALAASAVGVVGWRRRRSVRSG